MPREPRSKYFWPASALSEADMAMLYIARQASGKRIPITQLLATAVRATYGHLAGEHELKEAA